MTDTKLEVKDAHELDKKIPRDLIIMYQGKPYITKAGLAWKMNYLFGGKNWGVTNDIIERTPDYVLVKSTLRVANGMDFSNYGEASKANVSNPMMHKYLLHLAVTRAENRVIRTATACGYTSVDEIDMDGGPKELPKSEHDGEPATPAQQETLNKLDPAGMKARMERMDMTQREVKIAIDKALKKGK